MNFKSISLFKNLDQKLLKKISQSATLKKCPARSVIFDEGAGSYTYPFILKSGIVVISKTNYIGYETAVDIKYAGNGFGWASSIDHGPRTGRALAIVNTEYWAFDNFITAELLNNSKFNNNLLLYLLKYIRINENILANINSTQADQKILSQLLRIGIYNKKNNAVLIHNKINQGIIASFSGVSRETVSRELKILKNQSIIKLDINKNLIVNCHKANEMLNFKLNKK